MRRSEVSLRSGEVERLLTSLKEELGIDRKTSSGLSGQPSRFPLEGRVIIVHIEYQGVCPFVGIFPPSHPKASVFPLGPKGGREQHSLEGEGGGGPKSDDWTESLALCILCGLDCHLK
jgi:hypothetical protein